MPKKNFVGISTGLSAVLFMHASETYAACSIDDVAQKQVAVVVRTSGDVERAINGKSGLKVEASEGIRCNETLTTQAGKSFALLKLSGGGFLTLHPQSSLTIKPASTLDANVTFGDLKIKLNGRIEFSVHGKRSAIEAGQQGVVFKAGEGFAAPSLTPSSSVQAKLIKLEAPAGKSISLAMDVNGTKEVEVVELSGKLVKRLLPKQGVFTFSSEEPGEFYLHIFNRDENHARRVKLKRIRLSFVEKASVVAAGRGLASLPERGRRTINELQLEGSLWSAQSTDQKNSSSKQPTVGVIGLRWKSWRSADAYEIGIQSAALTAAPGSLTPSRFDIRYHRLFGRGSIFLAGEASISDGDSNFKTFYALPSLGIQYSIAFGSSWALTPLISFGSDFGERSTYFGEINLDRRLNDSSSIGAGARMQFFEQAKYREGHSEPYVYVKWSY